MKKALLYIGLRNWFEKKGCNRYTHPMGFTSVQTGVRGGITSGAKRDHLATAASLPPAFTL